MLGLKAGSQPFSLLTLIGSRTSTIHSAIKLETMCLSRSRSAFETSFQLGASLGVYLETNLSCSMLRRKIKPMPCCWPIGFLKVSMNHFRCAKETCLSPPALALPPTTRRSLQPLTTFFATPTPPCTAPKTPGAIVLRYLTNPCSNV